MSLISYAQNSEDIILWRALKSVEAGFYVDVGANDPHHMSVTKLFYEKGWRGINLDPIPQWFEKLVTARPRDINLQVGASDTSGELLIYEFADTGLSTFDHEAAERNRKEHGFSYTTRTVATERLSDICSRHHDGPIHFLKIDVEGAEEQVLKGLDLQSIRPWIILVESTLPLTQIESHSKWESQLVSSNYHFVYFDGLNRFYLATEHGDLAHSFRTPPNIFDGFRTCETIALEQRILTLEADNRSLQTQIEQQAAETARLVQREAHIQQVNSEYHEALQSSAAKLAVANEELATQSAALQSVLQSRSWRITAPLRLLSRLFHRKNS